jgi:competence protein ComGC
MIPIQKATQLKNNKGQTLIEFILLLLTIVIISLVCVKLFNSGIGNRWEALIKLITKPTETNIILL